MLLLKVFHLPLNIKVMKINKIKAAIVTALVISAGFNSTLAQDKKEATIKNVVETQQYIFKAQSVSPMTGSQRTLTSDYDLTVSNSSIKSYLPYFGVAYIAPINSSGPGIEFNTTEFQYTKEKSRKDGWDITIVPKNVPEIQKLFLHISGSGYTTLQVTSTNRQPISFYGRIEENKEAKKAF